MTNGNSVNKKDVEKQNNRQWSDIANKIAKEKDCDIYLYNGNIVREKDYELLQQCKNTIQKRI